MRQETAIEPRANLAREFWKTERRELVRSPAAHEQHDCSCPMRSSSLRSCARHDSHPCGRAGAIAGKHSAQAPKQILRKRKLQSTRALDLVNARTCPLPCELVTCACLARSEEHTSEL